MRNAQYLIALFALLAILAASRAKPQATLNRSQIMGFIEGMMRIEMKDQFGDDFTLPSWMK